MDKHPDGGEWEWKLESLTPDEQNNRNFQVQIPIYRALLTCGCREVRIVFQKINKPTGKLYIRTVCQGTEGAMFIKNLPREAKKLICNAYALTMLLS